MISIIYNLFLDLVFAMSLHCEKSRDKKDVRGLWSEPTAPVASHHG